jgi:TIR domain-containing protein
MNPSGGFSAFISYASEDSEKALDICKHLERRGTTCWIAPRNVRAGREYADEIVTGIERSACMIVLLSQAANTSAFVCREVERAVSNHKPIFPVRLEAVMPEAGLELFISGTHWLDVWEGDWDDHMRRLARDVADLTAGTSGLPAQPSQERRRLNLIYTAAALVLAAAGFGMWSYFPGRIQTPSSSSPVPSAAESGNEPAVPRSSPAGDTRSPAAVEPESGSSVAVDAAGKGSAANPDARGRRPQDGPVRAGPPDSSASPRTAPPSRGQPSAEKTGVPSTATVSRSAELDTLRSDYEDLAIRGEVIDDTLNRLWEEMRPLAPRVDMATRQRSLKVSLTRAREALGDRDAVAARRYLDAARADAAALDEFLGR